VPLLIMLVMMMNVVAVVVYQVSPRGMAPGERLSRGLNEAMLKRFKFPSF
jgi:hypothetical protein